MLNEVVSINLSFMPSKFTGTEIKEITAKVHLTQSEDGFGKSDTEITTCYSKTELQDKTLNEIYEHILAQAKQTLQRDIDDFPAL